MPSQLPVATEPLTVRTSICGQSGPAYTIQEVLAERREPLLCVYRARYDISPAIRTMLITTGAEGQSFIIKNRIPGECEYHKDPQKPLASSPNLRTVMDGLPGSELFIYPILQSDFLQFSLKNLSVATRKGMLKSALAGLAVLYERNIIHR